MQAKPQTYGLFLTVCLFETMKISLDYNLITRILCLCMLLRGTFSFYKLDTLTPVDISVKVANNSAITVSFTALQQEFTLSLCPDPGILHPELVVKLVDEDDRETAISAHRVRIFSGTANGDVTLKVIAAEVNGSWIIHIRSLYDLVSVEPMRWYDSGSEWNTMVVYRGYRHPPWEYIIGQFIANTVKDSKEKEQDLDRDGDFGSKNPNTSMTNVAVDVDRDEGLLSQNLNVNVTDGALDFGQDGDLGSQNPNGNVTSLGIDIDADDYTNSNDSQNMTTLIELSENLRRGDTDSNFDDINVYPKPMKTNFSLCGSKKSVTSKCKHNNPSAKTRRASTRFPSQAYDPDRPIYPGHRHLIKPIWSRLLFNSTAEPLRRRHRSSKNPTDTNSTECDLLAIVDYNLYRHLGSDAHLIIAALSIAYKYSDEILRRSKFGDSQNCGIVIKEFRIHTNYTAESNHYNARNFSNAKTEDDLMHILRKSAGSSHFYNFCLVHLNCKIKIPYPVAGLSYRAKPHIYSDHWSAGVCGVYYDEELQPSPSNLLLTIVLPELGIRLIVEFSLSIVLFDFLIHYKSKATTLSWR